MAEPVLLLRIIKTIVGLLGMIGNGIVCVVIYKNKFMHTLTNTFIFNQAVLDGLGSVMLILSSNIVVIDPLPDTTWYHFVCHIWLSNLFLWAFFTSSTVNLLSLTCERYVAIVYPFRYQSLYTPQFVKVIMVIIWFSGLILDGAYIVTVNTYLDGQCFYNSSVASRTAGIVFILVKFCVPAVFMLFVYMHITVELKRSARRVGAAAVVPTISAPSSNTANSENQEQSLLRARRNTFKTLFIVFVTFLVCWTPNQVIFFMFNFGWNLDFNGAVYIISVSLVAFNSCVNPFIYGFKYKQFRRGFLVMVGLASRADQNPSTSVIRTRTTCTETPAGP